MLEGLDFNTRKLFLKVWRRVIRGKLLEMNSLEVGWGRGVTGLAEMLQNRS